MTIGPGKYDHLATYVREKSKAEGVVVIINNGELGSGFSCQLSLEQLLKLPNVLRSVASQIEDDQLRGIG